MDSGATSPQPQDTEWADQYNFWHKILTEEVERLRFNQGLEPIDVDLYPTAKSFIGQTRIGHQCFRAKAFWCSDSHGTHVLRLQIRAQPQ